MMSNEETEEEEIRWREHKRAIDAQRAEARAEWQRRMVRAIGYGTLYESNPEDWREYDWRVGVDIKLPEDAHTGCIVQLEGMIEQVVKTWLMDYAPPGTVTGLAGYEEYDA